MNTLRALAATAPLFAPLAAVGQAATPPDAAAGTVMAVWVERDADFPYRGFTTHYSCDGIRGKVASILKAIGARPDFEVKVRSCVNDTPATHRLGGVEPMPWVYLRAALPQPATPELLAELAKPDAHRELVARVQGAGGTTATEATAQFPARPRQVSFTGSMIGPVQFGDCELLDEMGESVFTQIGAKILEDEMACVPHQVNPGSVRLTLEVLEPVAPEPAR